MCAAVSQQTESRAWVSVLTVSMGHTAAGLSGTLECSQEAPHHWPGVGWGRGVGGVGG